MKPNNDRKGRIRLPQLPAAPDNPWRTDASAPSENNACKRSLLPRILYSAFCAACFLPLSAMPAFATSATVWTKASEIMQDVYGQIVLISTVAAIVTASVALLMMNFSRSGKTVDESRAWLKRICITWAVLNSLGFIMAYVSPFFDGGKWVP